MLGLCEDEFCLQLALSVSLGKGFTHPLNQWAGTQQPQANQLLMNAGPRNPGAGSGWQCHRHGEDKLPPLGTCLSEVCVGLTAIINIVAFKYKTECIS